MNQPFYDTDDDEDVNEEEGSLPSANDPRSRFPIVLRLDDLPADYDTVDMDLAIFTVDFIFELDICHFFFFFRNIDKNFTRHGKRIRSVGGFRIYTAYIWFVPLDILQIYAVYIRNPPTLLETKPVSSRDITRLFSCKNA